METDKRRTQIVCVMNTALSGSTRSIAVARAIVSESSTGAKCGGRLAYVAASIIADNSTGSSVGVIRIITATSTGTISGRSGGSRRCQIRER